jgi:hypothetical protein
MYGRGWEEIGQQSSRMPMNAADGCNLAYLIYTSDRAGCQSGDDARTRPCMRLLCNVDYVGLGAGKRCCWGAASFDARP